MDREVICTGKTVEEAVEAALVSLGVSRDEVSVEVLAMPSKKVLGIFGGSDAQVKVTCQAPSARAEKGEKPRRRDGGKERRPETGKDQRPAGGNRIGARRDAAPSEPSAAPVEKPAEDKGAPMGTLCEKYLTEIIALMGVEKFSVTAKKEEGTLRVYVEGEKLGPVIGKHGETLDALQHLANLVNRKDEGTPSRVILDCGDYRSKREAYLTKAARSAAARAKKNTCAVPLEPMNAYERRFVHTIIQAEEGVSSRSVGEEPRRRVIIEAEGAPSYEERPGRRDGRRDGGRDGRRDGRRDSRRDGRGRSEHAVYEHEKGQPIGRREDYVPHAKRDVSLRTPSDSSFGGSKANDGELFALYEKIEPKFPPREGEDLLSGGEEKTED